MEQNAHRDTDVDSALDLIIGDTRAEPAPPTSPRREQRNEETRKPARAAPSHRNRPPSATKPERKIRPKARTGRPPGVKIGHGRPKDKTSLALDLELMDRYRKQSWKEECQLGELVERALRQYAQQTWGWRFKK